MDVDRNKENRFKSRFHSRGLSVKSKSSSSSTGEDSPISSRTPLSARLKSQCIPIGTTRGVLEDSQIDNLSPAYESIGEQICSESRKFDDVTSDVPQQSVVDAKLQEISGTPTVSLRKCLLDRQQASSRCDRDVSPGLQKLISTPQFEKVRSAIKTQLEDSLLGKSFTLQADKQSPGLTRLRQTPGKPLKEKQQVLANKHDETRRNADTLSIGGGIALWPEMDDMRLDRQECAQLALVSVLLAIVTWFTFDYVHGDALSKLRSFHLEMDEFSSKHIIDAHTYRHHYGLYINEHAKHWHQDFTALIMRIESSFQISANDVKSSYFSFIGSALYVSGISTLLYYLADNVMSSSKLSPNRIKKWVCLLVVVGGWTINMARLFVEAYLVEKSVVHNIQLLNHVQKNIISTSIIPDDYETTMFCHVISYWTTKYISAGNEGVINIFGIFKFNSLLYYIQYYSVPILTALVSPIVKLIFSVLHVYGFIEYKTEANQ